METEMGVLLGRLVLWALWGKLVLLVLLELSVLLEMGTVKELTPVWLGSLMCGRHIY